MTHHVVCIPPDHMMHLTMLDYMCCLQSWMTEDQLEQKSARIPKRSGYHSITLAEQLPGGPTVQWGTCSSNNENDFSFIAEMNNKVSLLHLVLH